MHYEQFRRVLKISKKPLIRSESTDVIYNNKRWTLLEELRKEALKIMEVLLSSNVDNLVHGSIARGDVTEKSDIDIFIPSQVSSFVVETTLEKAGITANKRLIVQATPSYAMKAHFEIDEGVSVSFPLMWLRKVEREFYRFGGQAGFGELVRGVRVSGVDKRLMLIEPRELGHKESSVVGQEELTAKTLRISVDTVKDRVQALLRRDEIGRTGVFLKEELPSYETFEMALKRLAKKNPAVRRRLASLS